MAHPPSGFQYELRGAQTLSGNAVVISHNGRQVATLRGSAAAKFLADVEDDDPQQLMARLTGNYKRGNERIARNHARNRDR